MRPIRRILRTIDLIVASRQEARFTTVISHSFEHHKGDSTIWLGSPWGGQGSYLSSSPTNHTRGLAVQVTPLRQRERDKSLDQTTSFATASEMAVQGTLIKFKVDRLRLYTEPSIISTAENTLGRLLLEWCSTPSPRSFLSHLYSEMGSFQWHSHFRELPEVIRIQVQS
ncbi:hypothetical protein TNCV_477751 [Trichonephila clavipes]|nr:hypothetical protein TNCV_477751 [Trichonephila clavipes]